MKNRIYKYFFYEFISYFSIVLFALTSIIWTIQAVNYLDLVTDDGHAFAIYLYYSTLTLPKIITKLIPFSFLLATFLTITKLDKDNELIVLWTSGLNKIYIVNLFFRISILIMLIQLFMTSIVTPETLNYSRSVLKNSQLQFVPSLLKEKQFNDTIKHLTVFVDNKRENGEYENIFIRDDSSILTKVSTGSSTIFAKRGYLTSNEENLILIDGVIQKVDGDKTVNVISFEETTLNLLGLSTKTISKPKLQETSTLKIYNCLSGVSIETHNCNPGEKEMSNAKIEMNKRIGMPFFIPLISLISCFLLTTRKRKKFSNIQKYFCFFSSIIVLTASEITVRYSGVSLVYAATYYLIPIGLLPLVYFILIKKFKYENL